MAKKKKISKKTQKAIKKEAKKHPVLVVSVVVVALVAAGVAGYILYRNGFFDNKIDSSSSNTQSSSSSVSSKSSLSTSSTSSSSSNSASSSSSSSSSVNSGSSSSSLNSSSSLSAEDDKTFDQISFYFISAGKSGKLYNGDSIYIKAGDNDILIDAGPKDKNCSLISEEINKHCTDNKLEYVVATHAHADHIPGFYGNSNNGIFYSYDVGTIIDFPKTDSTTKTYEKYKSARDYAVSNGAAHYTALECYNEQNGASKTYDLGKGLSMSVLYQKYYENKSTTENDYSVCLLFKQGDKKMLFTGDLEEDGVESLLSTNEIGKVDLYKGGHHGSINANPDSLLKAIEPETICTCCVAGSNEYTTNNNNTMPYQSTIDIWSKYTDDVYVTNFATSSGTKGNVGEGGELNGTINVNYDTNGTKTITGSNNSLKLKDTDWMKNNRTMPESWKEKNENQ